MISQTMIVFQEASILDVIKKIEKNKNGAVFVINDHEKIVGVITDGDVRRYIINQGESFGIHTPIFTLLQNKSFISISEQECQFIALVNIFQNHTVRILPIVDSHGKIISFLTKEDVHAMMLENKIFMPSFTFCKSKKNKAEDNIMLRPWGFYKSTPLQDIRKLSLLIFSQINK